MTSARIHHLWRARRDYSLSKPIVEPDRGLCRVGNGEGIGSTIAREDRLMDKRSQWETVGAFLVMTAISLVGCVTIPSKIIEIGPNTYSLNMTGVGFATQGNTNIKAFSEASAYCEKLHKHLLVDQSSEAGVYGWSPRQATLKFRCLSADDLFEDAHEAWRSRQRTIMQIAAATVGSHGMTHTV